MIATPYQLLFDYDSMAMSVAQCFDEVSRHLFPSAPPIQSGPSAGF